MQCRPRVIFLQMNVASYELTPKKTAPLRKLPKYSVPVSPCARDQLQQCHPTPTVTLQSTAPLTIPSDDQTPVHPRIEIQTHTGSSLPLTHYFSLALSPSTPNPHHRHPLSNHETQAHDAPSHLPPTASPLSQTTTLPNIPTLHYSRSLRRDLQHHPNVYELTVI